ncbi:MAG: M23 family metallopeptidase [Hoeflea sp.]|uniref:M23 family metallopeptidase n=1 Tax=Hoeflea sp. TaxID=1940281 RepID=UPI003EF140A3
MRFTVRMFAVVARMSPMMLASGCIPQDFGWSPVYKPAQQPKITVSMPANAPSISQQFLFTTGDAKHLGIDVIGKVGDPVIAVAIGQVTGSFSEPAYGNRVEITHAPDASGKRAVTVYKHLKQRLVKKGDLVDRGQRIGLLGATGVLSGGIPHLHFELYRQFGPVGQTSSDPHLYWVNGVGQVTCFDPAVDYDESRFRTTYPVFCRDS